MTAVIKTTAVFLRPFQLPGFNETLPPGEYEIETHPLKPMDWLEPGILASTVLVHLHPRASHPGLGRTLTVPLAELENAVAKDKLTGKDLTHYFLEQMLADPMIRLVMQADGWSEAEVRNLYTERSAKRLSVSSPMGASVGLQENKALDEPGPRVGSERPSIGE